MANHVLEHLSNDASPEQDIRMLPYYYKKTHE